MNCGLSSFLEICLPPGGAVAFLRDDSDDSGFLFLGGGAFSPHLNPAQCVSDLKALGVLKSRYETIYGARWRVFRRRGQYDREGAKLPR